MHKHQRGISLNTLIIGAFLLVVLGIFGLKLIPAYMENGKIKNIFNEKLNAQLEKTKSAV